MVSEIPRGFRSFPAETGIGKALPGASVVKNPPASAGDPGLIPGSGRFPWRRKWQPTPVFLPGESHGQRSLTGYSPWGCKERLILSLFFPLQNPRFQIGFSPWLLTLFASSRKASAAGAVGGHLQLRGEGGGGSAGSECGVSLGLARL